MNEPCTVSGHVTVPHEADMPQTADPDAYLRALTARVRALGNPRRAAAAQRDKGSRFEFAAVRVPVLRNLAVKDFAMTELDSAARLAVWDHIWRKSDVYEVLSAPLLHYRHLGLKIERRAFAVIRHWIDKIDDWGHCDDFAAIIANLNHNHKAEVFPYLVTLNRAAGIWRVRTSIAALVHYSGKNAVYLAPDEVFPLLDRHLGADNKYVANAVGWVLREMSHAYPAEIRRYVKVNAGKISSVALRKAALIT
jgi:3-methyladenine DNA glycosylase AlkD